jgi:hypothetical protein
MVSGKIMGESGAQKLKEVKWSEIHSNRAFTPDDSTATDRTKNVTEKTSKE